MRVRFWGTRGSLPKPGPNTVRYGGNTSCVQVLSKSGTLLIIDCGTGGHELGQALLRRPEQPVRGHILISHTHWDHIQGIPFFAPLFVPGNEWDFYAPQGFGQSLRDTLSGQMEYTYFPVTPEAFGAEVRYNNLTEGSFRIDDIIIHTHYLNHPALTLAYRIEADGVAIVYSCDHEPHARHLATADGAIEGQDLLHAEFLRDADLVIHDAQYTPAEYQAKIGWGHSTPQYAARICRSVGVKRLALTHHDPMRTDAQLDELVAGLREEIGDDPHFELFAAAEGMELDLEAEIEVPTEAEAGAKPSRTAISSEVPVLLVVANDTPEATLVMQAVAGEQVRVVMASSLAMAMQLYRSDRPSLVVIDDQLADGDALSLAGQIQESDDPGRPEVPMMILSRGPRPEASGLPAYADWLQAPFSKEYAKSRIRTWLMRGEFRWLRASMPEGEADRLAALHGLDLLDTQPEERFDRYTRLAATLFNVPVSLVTLIDEDRQWFKSCIGSDIRETSREVSFCAHAIQKREVMVVPDALLDHRFADNPLVISGPHVRFYAGAPLFVAGRHPIGTLCILDTRPRHFSEQEANLLSDLAAMVETELNQQQGKVEARAGLQEA